MVEEAEDYKEKIQSMQKYVQLLSKLISQLQEKSDDTPESIEKIRQLKILQQQLCDPNPGILLEELNKCEQVLENLFALDENKINNQTSQTFPMREDKELNNDDQKNMEDSEIVSDIENSPRNNREETFENRDGSLQKLQQKKEISNNNTKDSVDNVPEPNIVETSNILNTTVNYGKNESIRKTDIAFIITPGGLEKQNTKSFEKLNGCSEERDGDVTKISGNVIYEKNKLTSEMNDKEVHNETVKPKRNTHLKSFSENTNSKTNQPTVAEEKTEVQNIAKSQVKTESKTCPPDYACEKENAIRKLRKNSESEVSEDKKVTNEKPLGNELQPVKTNDGGFNWSSKKRSNKDNIDTLKVKKQKMSILKKNTTEPLCSVDPLAMDNENIMFSPKSSCGHSSDTDTDDVEIIESRNSPILIDSDEDIKKPETEVLKTKVRTFALKSTNPNTIREIDSNDTGICKRVLRPRFGRSKNPAQQNNFLSNIDLQPKGRHPRLFKTSVCARKAVLPNASYSATKYEKQVPQRKTIKDTSSSLNACSDAAHCRWLNNFLHHFCSSQSIVHKTSYSLLQQALRRDDYERIRRNRTDMASNNIDLSAQLMRQLRNICYADGDHLKQKLTFVGRRLCQLAIVNTLEKTVSLISDSFTNEVTSQTRIPAATLKAVKTDMSKSNPLPTDKNIEESNLLFPKNQSSKNSKDTSHVTSTLSNSSCSRNGSEPDFEYCPPCAISQSFTETPLRRSLRSSARHSSISENKTLTNTKNDEKDTIAFGGKKQRMQIKRVKPPVTAATEAYITQKRLAAKQDSQMKAKSFETAFIETVSQRSDSQTEKLLKASSNSTTNSVSSSETTNDSSEIFVISDDDDLESIKIQDQKEPTLHINPKVSARSCESLITTSKIKQTIEGTSGEHTDTNKKSTAAEYIVPKNISPEVHSESRFQFHCLVCCRPVENAVSHYVNYHPDHEVFHSRPPPQVARDMLNNKCGQAVIDQLQISRNLYIATCVFCQRKASFTLPYWYQHFASHTGEYAYKCTGCGIRKPTRSELMSHVQKQCTQNGNIEVTQEYDLDFLKVSAYTCKLCNYTKLNFTNVSNHLKNQHKMTRLINCKIAKVTLLKKPEPVCNRTQSSNVTSTKQNTRFYVHGGDNEIFEIAEIDDVQSIAESADKPAVINEAVCDVNWNSDPSVVPNNLPYIDKNIE